MGRPSKKLRPCVIVGWHIWKNLTGKEGRQYFFQDKYTQEIHSSDDWEGNGFFSNKKELAEFFGIGEDLKELDGLRLGQVFIRIFSNKNRLTDEEKEFWMSKAEGHQGKQVKITRVLY